MKPPAFAYHDPGTVEEACSLMASLDNARLLAGGQSMMPMLNMRFVMPDHLVDLGRIAALSTIEERPGTLRIGAMTRQRDLEHSAVVRARCPLLVDAIQWVGHRQTRNRGTVGGSLCHLDPAADLPDGSEAISSPVSGSIWKIAGAAGGAVKAGDVLEFDETAPFLKAILAQDLLGP
jgi:carbon-monoxide dehydrogenase medium subunit